MKDIITLKWKRTTFSKMGELQKTYWYMFTRANNIIYIGKTGIKSQQTVQDEIKSKKEILFEGSVKGVTVWLAYKIVNKRCKNPIQRLSEQIVHDVENLLIYAVKPSQNVQCVDNYNGRGLRIINEGCEFLTREIESPQEKGKIPRRKS